MLSRSARCNEAEICIIKYPSIKILVKQRVNVVTQTDLKFNKILVSNVNEGKHWLNKNKFLLDVDYFGLCFPSYLFRARQDVRASCKEVSVRVLTEFHDTMNVCKKPIDILHVKFC